jgi:hypothetical protein
VWGGQQRLDEVLLVALEAELVRFAVERWCDPASWLARVGGPMMLRRCRRRLW